MQRVVELADTAVRPVGRPIHVGRDLHVERRVKPQKEEKRLLPLLNDAALRNVVGVRQADTVNMRIAQRGRDTLLTAVALVACFVIFSNAPLSAQTTTPRSSDQSAAAVAKTIKITGYVNACYKPNRWIVFIESAERRPLGQPPRFESESVVIGPDGRFTVTLNPAKATPGDYYLNFGKTKADAGGLRFRLKAENLDLGQIGECDV